MLSIKAVSLPVSQVSVVFILTVFCWMFTELIPTVIG